MLALIFIPAGTLQYWQGWAYVAVFIICSGAYAVYLAKHDPALLKRRTEAGITYEKEFTRKVVMASLFAACIVLVVLAPLDVRFGWSLMPWQLSIIGDALVAFSFCIFYLVSKVNTYAAANVHVEEEQKVISAGVYGFVRHPMYFAAFFLFIGTPLALGSWWTLVLFPVFIPILVARILIGDSSYPLWSRRQGMAELCTRGDANDARLNAAARAKNLITWSDPKARR
jgi:protein-S-isoprenylcysteine O-methyltransferase Ste14